MAKIVTFLSILIASGLLAAGPGWTQDGDLTGDWVFNILTSPDGPGTRDVVIKQEGDKVIGFAASDKVKRAFVGSFDGTNLEFTAVVDFGGKPFGVDYVATVKGDTMAGTVTYGHYGAGTFEGMRVVIEDSTITREIIGSALQAKAEGLRYGPFFGQINVKQDVVVPELLPVAGGALPDFRMSRFPITNGQYQTYCAKTGCDLPKEPEGWDDYTLQYPNHPVVNVNWHDAKAYADWLSQVTGETYRLPTGAEWEQAARAGTEAQSHIWGNEWDRVAANSAAWRRGETPAHNTWQEWWGAQGMALSKSQPMTTQVGMFPANAWGFYDMAGNVWEWTMDASPQGGDKMILRGGSWRSQPAGLDITAEDHHSADHRLNFAGFRVVAEGRAAD